MTGWLQCQPTPTDAELQAERDAKHRRAVTEWMNNNEWAQHMDSGDNTSAVAIAYNEGWFEAFRQTQDLLAKMIKTVDPLGMQRVALIVASERLTHLANGRKVAG